MIYDVPPWLVILGVFALSMGFAALCHLVSRRLIPPAFRMRHREFVHFTAQNIALLYSVLLAFLAVATWQDLGAATANANQEAGLIANLYHDSQGMRPDLAADLRQHIARYLGVVVGTDWPMQSRGQRPAVDAPSLARLHRHVANLSPPDAGDAVLMADMLRTLNRIDDARATRIEAVGGHIPRLIWALIAAMGALTVFSVTMIDADTVAGHMLIMSGFLLGLALVLVMIVELDNPFRGTISVPVDPYLRVQALIEEKLPAADTP